jgi:predicted lipoprotein with Yx(FWY)xxD motif
VGPSRRIFGSSRTDPGNRIVEVADNAESACSPSGVVDARSPDRNRRAPARSQPKTQTGASMPIKKLMTMKSIAGTLVVAAILLGACGNDSKEKTDAGAKSKTSEATSTTEKAADDAAVTVKETSLGDVLVGKDGMTLYGFTNDVDGNPTCVDKCADAWPAALVDTEELPAGLDSAVFSVVERPDDTYQLKAGDWPLYYYSGDKAEGDVNGQGVGGIWFVVAEDGTLIKDEKPADDSKDDSSKDDSTTTTEDSGY